MKREWLIELRKSKQLTQEDVADSCDVVGYTISCIETGKRRPSVELAMKLAKLLNFRWEKFYVDDR